MGKNNRHVRLQQSKRQPRRPVKLQLHHELRFYKTMLATVVHKFGNTILLTKEDLELNGSMQHRKVEGGGIEFRLIEEVSKDGQRGNHEPPGTVPG